jgi:hypothetical protein
MFIRALSRTDDQAKADSKKADDPVKSIEGYLLDRGWPDDSRFETAFVDFPLYERGYTREVLATLERARGHKEPADLSETQVEHIMPQTLSDRWKSDLGQDAEVTHAQCLHWPGNLTLSGYNLELWNHPFSEKVKRYKQSNIVITRELGGYKQWGEHEIRARGLKLAQESIGIWIGPKENIPSTESDDGSDEDTSGRRELRARFWRGLNDFFATEHPELPNFEPGQGSTIRLPSGVRYIGLDMRFALRHQSVALDVWFWREASYPVWQEVRKRPDECDSLIGEKWEFEQVEGQSRGRMSIHRGTENIRLESSWPDLYHWIGEKSSLIYEVIFTQSVGGALGAISESNSCAFPLQTGEIGQICLCFCPR